MECLDCLPKAGLYCLDKFCCGGYKLLNKTLLNIPSIVDKEKIRPLKPYDLGKYVHQ
jgi:hypothetical protein